MIRRFWIWLFLKEARPPKLTPAYVPDDQKFLASVRELVNQPVAVEIE